MKFRKPISRKDMMTMKKTINEVAKLAGVSKATVSHVINDSKPTNWDLTVLFQICHCLENVRRNLYANSISESTGKF